MTEAGSVLELFGSSIQAKIHPVVMFSVLDHFSRRNAGSSRVIGTLLGTVVDGVVHIKSSFPVPHTETDEEINIDADVQATFFELHNRINPREVVVGWYSTGSSINDNDVKIHSHYATLSQHAIHLTVDTDLTGDSLGIRAFVGQNLSIGGKALGLYFQQVKIETKSFEAERIGVDFVSKSALAKPDGGSLSSDLETLEMSLQRVLDLLSEINAYTDKVLDGSQKGDNKVGRFLFETVSAVPRISQDVLQKKFQNSVQDLLMVVYLSSLTRTQLALAHRLSLAI